MARSADEATGPPGRSSRRAWATVGAVAALMFSALVVLQVRDRQHDQAQRRKEAELAEVAAVPGRVMDDLQNERNLTAVTLTGLEGSVELPIDTIEEARRAVDGSTADLEEVILGNETAARAYRDAFAALSELSAARAAVDQDGGPRSLDNLPAALSIYDKYSEVIGAFLDGMTRLVVGFDEGELWQGAELIHLTSRQIETVTVLLTRLIFGFVQHGDRLFDDRGEPVDRELVAEVRWLSGDFEQRRAELGELATGKYEAAATKALQKSDEWGFEELVASILDGERYEAASLLEAVSTDPDSGGYRGLRSAVESILRNA